MGKRKRRVEHFLAEHPACAFCGGNRRAETEDHVPSRALFATKSWPEGYVFPACNRCNSSTRYDEMIIALISRFRSRPESDLERQEFMTLAKGIRTNLPEVLNELNATDDSKARKAIEKYGLDPSCNDALNVSGPLVNRAIQTFGLKLTCALFYKHAGRALPETGGVLVKWWANLQIAAGEFPDEVRDLVSGKVKLMRNAQDLSDQFDYRHGLTDDLNLGAFVCRFGSSFILAGIAAVDADSLDAPETTTVLRPRRY